MSLSPRDFDIILAWEGLASETNLGLCVCCSITNLIFILGIMSSSGLCVSCNKLLTSPDANFCAKCGAPQTRPQLCIHCEAQLPDNSPYCSKCGEPQPHPKQQEPSVKWCRYCKTQLPPDAIYCIKCSKPPMTSSQEPVKSSCILCKRSLKGTPQNCNFCSAPQDSSELIKRSFKECHKCGRRVFNESKVCIYQNCLALQETPPSTPAPEGMQLFTPQAPPNLEHFHESQGIQSPDPSQLPRDLPDTSLQPTDKPFVTREEMEKKFKSSLPPVTSTQPTGVDTTSVATGSTQNSLNVTSITSAVTDPKKDEHVSPMETGPDVSTGRVSGPHKRSSDDEEESGDISKRVKTSGGAAVASGAVLLEKVDDTYAITGETTATSGNASFLPPSGTSSTGDNTSLQTAARKRKQSDLDESKDSLVPPHPKKPETADKTHDDKDNEQEMERHETKNDQKKEFEKEQHGKTTLDDSRGGDKEVPPQGKEGENAAAPGHNRKDGGGGDSEDGELKESKEGPSSDRNGAHLILNQSQVGTTGENGQSFVAEASDSDSAPSPGTPLKPHPPAPSSDSQATSSSEVASLGLPLGQGNNSGDSPPSSTTDPLLNINPADDKPPHPIQETNGRPSNTDPKLAHPMQETNGGPSNTDPKPTHPVQETNSTQQANDKPSNGKPSPQLTVQHDGSQSPSDKGKKVAGEKKGDQQSVTGGNKKQDKDKNDKKEAKPALPVPNP